ncbi:MAG: AbrB/MazE/SpoVT family DNA-binding domain-containing protein, partial [Kiritimatiellia bacterium]
MNTSATRITERGQVSIPAEIREQLHWTAGQRILWEVAS